MLKKKSLFSQLFLLLTLPILSSVYAGEYDELQIELGKLHLHHKSPEAFDRLNEAIRNDDGTANSACIKKIVQFSPSFVSEALLSFQFADLEDKHFACVPDFINEAFEQTDNPYAGYLVLCLLDRYPHLSLHFLKKLSDKAMQDLKPVFLQKAYDFQQEERTKELEEIRKLSGLTENDVRAYIPQHPLPLYTFPENVDPQSIWRNAQLLKENTYAFFKQGYSGPVPFAVGGPFEPCQLYVVKGAEGVLCFHRQHPWKDEEFFEKIGNYFPHSLDLTLEVHAIASKATSYVRNFYGCTSSKEAIEGFLGKMKSTLFSKKIQENMNLYHWKSLGLWFLVLPNGNVQSFNDQGLKNLYDSNKKLRECLPGKEAPVIGGIVLHESGFKLRSSSNKTLCCTIL